MYILDDGFVNILYLELFMIDLNGFNQTKLNLLDDVGRVLVRGHQ